MARPGGCFPAGGAEVWPLSPRGAGPAVGPGPALRAPDPDLEFRFAPPRRWRFDLAWPALKVACEYEGLHAAKSRHTTVTGFMADCEKYNAATLAGWRVYRVTARHVENGTALKLLEQALAPGA